MHGTEDEEYFKQYVDQEKSLRIEEEEAAAAESHFAGGAIRASNSENMKAMLIDHINGNRIA